MVSHSEWFICGARGKLSIRAQSSAPVGMECRMRDSAWKYVGPLILDKVS